MAAYVVAFAAVGAATGSSLTVPYVVVVLALAALVVRLDRSFDFGSGLLWALAVWGLAHMAGGTVPLDGGDGDRVLYNARFGPDLIRYDRLVHAFGFGAATVACGKVLRSWLPAGRAHGPAVAVMVVLAGMGIGALNEMVEFGVTLVVEDTNVGGFDNTGWDLVFDFLGAGVAGAWFAREGT